MSAMERTAIVVAAHRMYETMGLCLRGLLDIAAQPADLIFVDNGSGGALSQWAVNSYPGITVLTLDSNHLFCGGFNAGIRHAMALGYDHVLIVNADAEVVNPPFLHRLVTAMRDHPTAAFLGPRVLERSGGPTQTTCLRFPRLMENLLVYLPFRFFPRLLTRQPAEEHEVEYLNGVCVLCRVAALREFGLMDETFGAYLEDADWSWRARLQGWRSYFIPVSSVVHHIESHGYEHHSFKTFLVKRNLVYWFLKSGRRYSAKGYATAAILLAWLRVRFAPDATTRSASEVFLEELQAEYRRLLYARTPQGGAPLSVPLPENARIRIEGQKRDADRQW